ncbi:MAG: hypothetical protein HQL35_09840 [Alphaproteobacteria bacterium]|nr:hypothetical protein [Alphaproteobacteria bacterium]
MADQHNREIWKGRDEPQGPRERGKAGDCEVIPSPIKLKVKTGDGPAKLPRKKAQELDQLIESQRDLYLEILDQELRELRRLVAGIKNHAVLTVEENRGLFFIAHRIRGEAVMNGQNVVGIIANLLCECLDTPDMIRGPQVPFIALHVEAMVASHAAQITGETDVRAQEIINGFKAARAKLLSA